MNGAKQWEIHHLEKIQTLSLCFTISLNVLRIQNVPIFSYLHGITAVHGIQLEIHVLAVLAQRTSSEQERKFWYFHSSFMTETCEGSEHKHV